MSDQELSDIIAYIRSLPPVDHTAAPRSFGPVFTMLLATEQIETAASRYAASTAHPAYPPEAEMKALWAYLQSLPPTPTGT